MFFPVATLQMFRLLGRLLSFESQSFHQLSATLVQHGLDALKITHLRRVDSLLPGHLELLAVG